MRERERVATIKRAGRVGTGTEAPGELKYILPSSPFHIVQRLSQDGGRTYAGRIRRFVEPKVVLFNVHTRPFNRLVQSNIALILVIKLHRKERGWARGGRSWARFDSAQHAPNQPGNGAFCGHLSSQRPGNVKGGE